MKMVYSICYTFKWCINYAELLAASGGSLFYL